jgi:HD-GYP domain-containing protein (c-di-GMP phosphodiesterase class II)
MNKEQEGIKIEDLLKEFAAATHEVSKGNYGDVERIFELTREGNYPGYLTELAESFGMMVVKIEARETQLEAVIDDLKQKKTELERAARGLMVANMSMLEVLGNAIAKRDSDTSDHNYRVTIYSTAVGKAAGLNKKSMQCLIKGSLLHDAGKIGIRDNILLKPGRLTTDEFEIMKNHVSLGAEIIRGYEWLQDALEVVLMHHEKYDGSGYMGGLKGDEIPLNARIFAIVDVFDALTSKRPYKEALSYDKTIQILNESKGSHFDPSLLDIFLGIAHDYYHCVYDAGEEKLKKEMETIILNYFTDQ